MSLSPWARCWCVVAALGMGLAVLEWSPLVATVAFLAVLGCVATVSSLLPASHAHSTLVVSLVAASWSIALVALLSSSPALALLVVLLVVATSPPVLRLLRGTPVAESGPDPARPAGPPAVPRDVPPAAPRGTPPAGQPGRERAVHELDDRQLCTLWRQLFWQLVDQRSTEGVLSTVAWRQACLDELERRDPAAVRAWIDSGARASGGPERFLTDHGRHGDADAA
jgi:hypothetical protein